MCIFARGGPNVFTNNANFHILLPKSEVNSRSRIALSVQMTLVITMRYKEIQVMCRTPRSENAAWASLQILRFQHNLRQVAVRGVGCE